MKGSGIHFLAFEVVVQLVGYVLGGVLRAYKHQGLLPLFRRHHLQQQRATASLVNRQCALRNRRRRYHTVC